jgi:hypothetical protein
MQKTLSAISILAITTVYAAVAGFAAPASSAQRASHNDTAKFLAGLPPSSSSPIAALTKTKSWRRHAKSFNSSWRTIESRQLSKIRKWAKSKLPGGEKTMLYFFSGPDFLYANSFFGKASTYVFVGLEPVGREPDLTKLSRRRVAAGLSQLRSSVRSVLRLSFFLTKEMRVKLRRGRFPGTIPVLYAFLARADKTVKDISYVNVNRDGELEPLSSHKGAKGVKIEFLSKGRSKRQTLYYFSTDLSNGGVKRSGFLKFVSGLGPADSFLKSASYLMHSGNFSAARSFLLQQSQRIVQDDSGIPLRHFNRKDWKVVPYGRYTGPIRLFANKYQSDMRRLFRTGKPKPIKFGMGYRWRPRQTSVLLAIKRPKKRAALQLRRPSSK